MTRIRVVPAGGGGTGTVTGPTITIGNGIARFVGTNGQQITGSNATIDDNGTITAEYAHRQSFKNASFLISPGDAFSSYLCGHTTPITATLGNSASFVTGFRIAITDFSGDAGKNNITIYGGSFLINGFTSLPINVDRASYTLEAGATFWAVV